MTTDAAAVAASSTRAVGIRRHLLERWRRAARRPAGSRWRHNGLGYGDAGASEEPLERYRAMSRAVHDSQVLAGVCWTLLTDTYREVNGLLRADRTPKVDVELLSAATRGRACTAVPRGLPPRC